VVGQLAKFVVKAHAHLFALIFLISRWRHWY